MRAERTLMNVGASVRQRLYNRARERGEDLNVLLSRYAVERMLYRLSRSEHAKEFVLKGAQLFCVWTTDPYRATRDLDLLKRGDPSIPHIEGIIRSLCRQPVAVPDGIEFLAETVRGEPIREETEYGGTRIRVAFGLAGAKGTLQIDIGVGDAVTPAPELVQYPSLIGLPAPNLQAYPREAVVAEKFHAMVTLGITNSRMKDFYDLHVLHSDFPFEGSRLAEAIGATFGRRGTPIPVNAPLALTAEFAGDATKQTQWAAFLRRGRLSADAPDLTIVIEGLRGFLMPPMQALAAGVPFRHAWPAGGDWQPGGDT